VPSPPWSARRSTASERRAAGRAGLKFLVVAVVIALALPGLVAMFAYTAMLDGRPDSRSYLAELEGTGRDQRARAAPSARASRFS
jgi:hypothetical protein